MHASGRRAVASRWQADEFYDKNFNNPNVWTYEPDLSRPVSNDSDVNDGRLRLTFDRSGTPVAAVHDAVILTLPYSTLRLVSLHASLGLPSWQQEIIQAARPLPMGDATVGVVTPP